jgi:predicted permease
MRLGRILRQRWRSLFRRAQAETEMQRELDLHLEQLTREFIAGGMSPADARLAAIREFGSTDFFKEECRDMRRVNWIHDLGKDAIYACRLLRKSPGFTLTAVLSLALGIGANTAIFSMVNALLLRPLPYPHPERLAMLFERNLSNSSDRANAAPGNFLDWQKQSAAFEHISAFQTRTVTLSGNAAEVESERVAACTCSANIFETLEVQPALGRAFTTQEDQFGAPRLAIIGYPLWQRRFGGRRDAIGQSLRIDANDYRIIGVMPRAFAYPANNIEVWIPLLTGITPQIQIRHDLHNLTVIGRLRAGTSIAQGAAEVDGISARYKNAHPQESTGRGAMAIPLHDVLVEGVRTPLVILLGAVVCVLLIACVNIANLVLTRSIGRTREIGLRACLGAGRGRIVRQLVTESVLLSIAGGTLGVLLALSISTTMAAHAPNAAALLPDGKLPLDPLVFIFAFTAALLAGVVVGLFPAIRVSRMELAETLKDTTRSATASRAHGRFRSAMVAAEVALAGVLLIASGLLLRSFQQLHQVQPGVRLDDTVVLSFSMPGENYRTGRQRGVFLEQLADRLRQAPGIRTAGLSSCTPLTGACNVLFYYVDGRPFEPGKFLMAMEQSVDTDYFAAAGVPLVKGRTFTQRDGIGSDAQHPRPGSIIISETMAKTVFPNEDPMGKRIFFDYEVQAARLNNQPVPHYQVIGIAADVRPTLADKPYPMFYRPLLDNAGRGITAILHAASGTASAVSAARGELRRLDPSLPVFRVQTMDEVIGRSTADRRFSTTLYLSFAGLALLLATIGLYGLVSYTVSQRRGEIGVRMALGANASDVRRLVLLEGLRPAMVGMAIGMVAAAFACRLLRTQLFGIEAVDPTTYASVPIILTAVAALACYLPALRATRFDPAHALRAE